MSARREEGIASVILLFVILLLVGGGAVWVYFKGYTLPLQKVPQSTITQNQDKTPPAVDPKETDGWQSYLIKYGQLRVKYPPNWLIKENQNQSSGTKYIDFLYSKEKGVISDQYLLTITIEKSSETSFDTTYLQKNFIIPALGNTENAYYLQNGGPATIRFDRNGVSYSMSVNTEAALSQGIDPGESVNILSKMAKTLTFEDVANSCTEPVIKPLETFPSSFVLLNNHLAASSEKARGYWPNLDLTNNQPPSDASNMADAKIFVVTYQKDGNPFGETDAFRKTVVEVSPGSYFSPNAGTSIVDVNCPELLTKSTAANIYLIGRTGLDPLEIDVYGKSSNSTDLWGVQEWTINLLKQTRNVVYVKKGDMWQKYSAQNYYLTR